MSLLKAPPGDRFYVRVNGFDIACPRCGATSHVNKDTSRSCWEPRTCRWSCRECFLVLTIGIIGWPRAKGRWGQPNDTTPTVREALALRQGLGLWAQTRLKRGRPVNALVLDEQEGGTGE